MSTPTELERELERVVDELYEFDFYTDGGNIGGHEVEPWLRRSLKSYAQTVAEEAVREEKKRIFQKYNVSRKESKKERAQGNAWNDLGNTLRNGV